VNRAAPWFFLALALFAGGLAGCSGEKQGRAAPKVAKETPSQQLYVCRMGHVPPLPHGGPCPVCGMQLVPQSKKRAAAPSLTLAPGEAEASGIALARVQRGVPVVEVVLHGAVEPEAAATMPVVATTCGIVTRVFAAQPGEIVGPGRALADILCPDILDLENRLLLLARSGQDRPGEAPARAHGREAAALREKLRRFGLTDRDIDEALAGLRPMGVVTVRVPAGASNLSVVAQSHLTMGGHVDAGDLLASIARDQATRAVLPAQEPDCQVLRQGQAAAIVADERPEEVFQGSLVAVGAVDPVSHACPVTVAYNDPLNILPRGARVAARIAAEVRSAREGSDEAPLVIPNTAPLLMGNRVIVYVAASEDRRTFERRDVFLGPKVGDVYPVLEGLTENELVAGQGVLALDGEFRLHGKPGLLRLDDPEK